MTQQESVHIFALAWLDMLGWRDLPEDPAEREAAIQLRDRLIAESGRLIAYPPDQTPSLSCGQPVISLPETDRDAVIVHHAFAATGDLWGYEAFFGVLEATILKMFQAGFLMRGGITSDINSNQKRAIARAKFLEKYSADVPRVVLDNDGSGPCYFVYDRRAELMKSADKFKALYVKTGIWWFDFLRYAGWFPKPAKVVRENTAHKLSVIRPVLENNLARFAPSQVTDLERSVAHLKTFGKYKWYADYHNKVAVAVGMKQIDLNCKDFK